MVFRLSLRGAAGVLLVVLLASACATSAPEVIQSRVSEREGRYLISPLSGYPLTADSELSAVVRQAYEELMAGDDPAMVAEVADRVLAMDSGFHPAMVLRAQTAFLEGNDLAVLEGLRPVADELSEYSSCQLLRGRAAERRGEVLVSFEAFRRIAGRSAVASRRAEDLLPRAREILDHRFNEALDRGRFEDAEAALQTLRDWLGPEPALLDYELEIAIALGDEEQELGILRQLTESADDRILRQRRAELELRLGEVRQGLEAYEELATEFPEDAQLADGLDHAKFLWRLQVLPPYVQELGRKAELDRSDFATLLYWLIPQVRFSRLDRPPIANDILDHPRRKEILPVTDLGLLEVNKTLHRFNPSEPVSRGMAFYAFLRLLDIGEHRLSCLAPGQTQALRRSTSLVCAKAAQCRLIAEVAECLPSAPLSGSEALELFRFETHLMGSDEL